MKIKPLKFERLTRSEKEFKKALNKTKKFYRPLDPGQYLYNLLLEKRKRIDIFSEEYLKLIYTTLIAWNMNGRGAKLNDFEKFKTSIKDNKNRIKELKRYRIEKLNVNNIKEVLEIVGELFKELDLVGNSWTGKKIKSKIVAFSKTMHFLLPNLIVPIDRKYTINFFYSNKRVPTHKNPRKNDNKQIEMFNEIFEKFCEISQKFNLKKYEDKKWNINVPKIIDNAIIGYGLDV